MSDSQDSHHDGFTHLDRSGAARMVDVSGKEVTTRTATATGVVFLTPETIEALRHGDVPKGDALAVARIAGIQAAKRTPDLVPLCHPIAIHGADVTLTVDDERGGVAITATTRTADRTGVEMEALTCVMAAALALVDMVKALDPEAVVSEVRVEEKTGGKTGYWHRSA
ncbi:cyclic pyranopterin monophosphate synthase MoaC [Salinactinospora qingdaonensis]|uniref:Cyclic pyranopterin monophosphate synthase n=1 Tax=Salinactinospora qingdaonensis TaxID=702744 RepID=A0ABP7FNN0_9ACTN